MRTRQAFIQEYAKSHQNLTNQIIHLICVPVIFFATAGLFWMVPIGQWLGLEASSARYVNLATLSFVPMLLFYARLGFSSVVTGLVYAALSVALCVWIENAGQSVLMTSAIAWIAAWAVQFYGHHVEGAKPSFADDLVFLLIGPLFVEEKIIKLLKGQSLTTA